MDKVHPKTLKKAYLGRFNVQLGQSTHASWSATRLDEWEQGLVAATEHDP